ncbi:hypothetical protein SAMN04488082_11911 [Desulfomicrobium apsheronum]|uniref:Uncharacterized protein n=1 Tax=Desulfomicrobium apsheronum TaxID=52560 RepID=A0A1I3Y7C2_9BACT|nr:hypothetical protein SAMN04488082_11911 [Desulfomicrobium apsheronum]
MRLLVSPILQAARHVSVFRGHCAREEVVTWSRSHHGAKLPLQDLKLPAIPGSQARSV